MAKKGKQDARKPPKPAPRSAVKSQKQQKPAPARRKRSKGAKGSTRVNRSPDHNPPQRVDQPSTQASGAGEPKREGGDFPVVGIGASAGGLDAMRALLTALPADTGMAFVLVIHLDPTRESFMTEILARETQMPVIEAVDGTEVRPDHLYVILPDNTLTIEGDILRTGKPHQPRGRRRPIDDFFASLAGRGERSVAVILSGAGSNGSSGAKDIKAAGGVILAQDPETAQFPSMPQAAITSGIVDQVLSPSGIAGALVALATGGYVRDGGRQALSEAQLKTVLSLLRLRSKRDFSAYKPGTLSRRIHRRLSLAGLTKVEEYVEMLRRSAVEAQALVDDLLINVTGFFRDPAAWRALEKEVIEPLVAARESGSQIRGWVAGCSSGEEAYALAMLIDEAQQRARKQFEVRVFATDVAEAMLSMGRTGTYPESIEAFISPQRLERYFEAVNGTYRVKKPLRELVTFAPQNLLADPPFSRLDVITCRNVLIYLEPEVQQRVLALLHFGLREGGYLFLGPAETVGRMDELFEPVSKKWRIFRRTGPTRHDLVEFPARGSRRRHPAQPAAEVVRLEEPMDAAGLTRTALLDRFAPAAMLVDQKMRVVYFHGDLHRYLTQPPGEPTRQLLSLVNPNLRLRLRQAVLRAASEGEPATARASIRRDGQNVEVIMTASRVQRENDNHLVLVSFEEKTPSLSRVQERKRDQADAESADRAYETDLRSHREELQRTVEELETANEELKASNEEITSINEELQSANEELETSKEELQSLNEELNTVNHQLQAKLEQVEESTSDLANLLHASDIATLFLDRELRIKWLSPAVSNLLSVINTDIGRPLGHFTQQFAEGQNDLEEMARQVLRTLVPRHDEARDRRGRWYLRRLLPYRTSDDRIDGVVVTFVDITERREAEEQAIRAREEAEAANAAKDKFLAMVSHELRTPLNPALMTVELLQTEKNLPESVRADLEVIARNIHLEARLINDLLDLSRAARGNLALEMSEVDPCQIIEAAVKFCEPDIRDKNLTITTDAPKGQHRVRADETRLQQIVWNLLRNAVKFTPRGGRIEMRCHPVEGGRIAIEVSDSGVGIEPEMMERIFEAFEQAGKSGIFPGGLGLGLTIAKAMVEAHGGSIEAHSEGRDKGATFRVLLPRIDSEPDAERAKGGKGSKRRHEAQETPRTSTADSSAAEPVSGGTTKPVARRERADQARDGVHLIPQIHEEATAIRRRQFQLSAEASHATRGGLRILLVEDHWDTARLLKRLLEQEGYDVVVASDAASARRYADRAGFDVLISDIGLPDGDGWSLRRDLGRRGEFTSIALSGYGSEDDLRRSREAGFDAHITKPMSLQKLSTVLEQFAVPLGR